MLSCLKNRAVAAATLSLVAFDPVIAAEPMPTSGPEEKTEEVVVTGTHIRGLPKEYVASPVFTHTQADIEQSGFGSLSEYMQSIPQNFTGDASEFATTGVAFGAGIGGALSNNQFDGFAGFSLRGLGSDATLTLLNGRRLPSAGMVEAPTVSFIPSALIERIEIIPDGASATYGADAVGGVVNLVTRKAFDGVELRVRGSTATEVDRDEYQVSAMAGHSWADGSVYGMAAFQDREPFVSDPVRVGNSQYEITATPDEALVGFFAGVNQRIADLTLSFEGSYFESDRSAYQLTLPDNDRRFDTRSKGHSLYSSANWQASPTTSFDVTADYHENQSTSIATRRGALTSARDYTNRLFVAEARGQTTPFSLPGGTVQLAGGAQYRRETLLTDATVFFSEHGGARDVSSVFAEVYVPLIGRHQDVTGVRSLTLSAAARYEDFGNPIGSALAPKLGLRWHLTDDFSLRTTFSRSFLVPRLRDTSGIAEQVSFQVQPDTFLDPAQQDPRLPAGQSLVLFRAGSNPNLQSQDADTFTFGFDFNSAIDGLSVSAGYYRVKISDRVLRPGVEEILSDPDLQIFAPRSPRPDEVLAILSNPVVSALRSSGVPFISNGRLVTFATAASVPADLISSVQVVADIRAQNFAVEETDGLDLELNYRRPLRGGDLSFRLSGQYILALERRAGGGSAQSRLDTIFAPVDLTLSANTGWRRGPFSVGSVINYVDGYVDNRAGRNDARIGSYTTASLFLGWETGRGSGPAWLGDSSIQLVVANLFDRQPPQIAGEVLAFDPYNIPPNPRTVALILTKRLGR